MQKWVSNIVVLLFLMVNYALYAQSEVQLLNHADSLFNKKKYAEAQEVYYQLFQQGYYTSASLLKMAFVYEGLDDIPKALFFLSQYHQKTGDPKAYDKIMVLSNARNLSGYEQSDKDRIQMWISKQSNLILSALLVLILGSFLLTLTGSLKSINGIKITFGALTIVFIALLMAMINFGQPTEKAILLNQAYVMTGPSVGSDFVTMLEGGNQVPVLDRQDVWIKISWNNKIGFIKKGDLLVN